MGTARTIHLIDASPYIFRAYFALPESITDAAGGPAQATWGFGAFLLQYVEEQQPTHLGVAFDESLSTSFRNEIYPDYKAQRELPPEALEAQLHDCRELAAAFGAATYVDPRYEADDLIGTLTHQLLRAGHRVVVVSPDKDLTQLVTRRVEMHDVARGRRYDAAGVHAAFGVRPEQIPDYLGLAGDAVDNIPGVAGIGVKTAAALLAAFDDLESLYADVDLVAGLSLRGAASVCEKLRRDRDRAFLSRELATIARDAPCRARLREMRLTGPDDERLAPLLERLGFESLGERVRRTL
jgi:5'-3' exonuclease